MATVNINGNDVDPKSQQKGGAQYAADASASEFVVVQCSPGRGVDSKKALRDLKLELLERLNADTFLCRYVPADLSAIRNQNFVVYANVYHPDLVVEFNLKKAVAQNPASDQVRDVYVMLHQKRKATQAETIAQIKKIAGINVTPNIAAGSRFIPATVPQRFLEQIAKLDEVCSIGEVPKVEFNVFTAAKTVASWPYLGQQVANIPDQGAATGDSETIVIVDSGFDTGDAANVHPAFTNRVARVVAASDRCQLNDTNGHGTFVAGCALGNGTSSQFPGKEIQGTAPAAKLYSIGVFNPNKRDEAGKAAPGPDFANVDLAKVFGDAYKEPYNARIFNCSYGLPLAKSEATYSKLAAQYDQIAYDTPDLLIVTSAGNKGQTEERMTDFQLSTEGTAKNVLTVGYTVSEQPRDPKNFMKYKEGGGIMAPNQVHPFSSRGPTWDGRIKPDVMAPGGLVYSTRSRSVADPVPAPNPWSLDAASGTSTDRLWRFDSGSSFAAPLVAGCCAVVRAVYRKKYPQSSPTSACLKALIINGAIDMEGGNYWDVGGALKVIAAAPNAVQGFGRVNLAASVRNVLDGTVESCIPIDEDTEEPVRKFEVPRAGMTLSATLCWTDPTGLNPGTACELFLKVTASSQEYMLSNKSGKFSAGNAGTPDKKNNAQKVVWKDIPQGGVTIEIKKGDMFKVPVVALVWNLA